MLIYQNNEGVHGQSKFGNPWPIAYCSCHNNLCLIPRNRRSKHDTQQVFRGPIKSAELPAVGPRPTTGHSIIH